MTPARLAELQAAWPGEWEPAEHPWHADVCKLRVPIDAEWSVFAFAYGPDHYIEARSQDRDDTALTGRGKSFSGAKSDLAAAIAATAIQLLQLVRMVP